jgi:hypothetical protein
MTAGLSSPEQLGAIGVAEASWLLRLTPTPPANIVGLATDQVSAGGGGTENSNPTMLSSQAVGLFTGTYWSR